MKSAVSRRIAAIPFLLLVCVLLAVLLPALAAAKSEPKPYLNLNWIPATVPPPVKGYRIETCIHSCWQVPGLSDFPGITRTSPESGLAMGSDIVDNLRREYGNVGVTVGYLSGDNGRKFVQHMESNGMIPFAEGHSNPGTTFLRRHKAFTINWDGANPMEIRGGLSHHCEDMTDPRVLAELQDRILTSAKAGAKAWRSVDYVWHWWGGPIWGYSDAAIRRWREDLSQTDVGLAIVEDGKQRTARFWEYFESYHGYRMKPEDVGIGSWDEYRPPKKDAPASYQLANNSKLFGLLFHYEWVKYINEAARPAALKYGCLAQPICNPENYDTGTDLYWLMRCAYVRGFCTEWWNSAGVILSTYYNGPYYGNLARSNGKELVLLGESASAGNQFFRGPNYWDNMSNYLITYSQSGSVDFKARHNQYWGTSWKRMTDPGERVYEAYTAFRSTWCGFLQCRNDKAVKPRADVLAISMRSVAHRISPFDREMGQPYNLAESLSRLNYLYDGAAFPIRGAYDLGRYHTVVYSPFEPPQGFARKLGKWVSGDKNRTIITHSFVPTRFSSPLPATEGDDLAFLQPGGQEKLLGFERIGQSGLCSGAIKVEDPGLVAALSEYVGREITFSRGICEATGGRALVSLGRQPLVTERRCGKGRVLYIHFFPGDKQQSAGEFETALMDALMQYCGYKPSAIMAKDRYALAFDCRKGRKAFVIYNDEATTDTLYRGETCRVFQAQDPESSGIARLLAGRPNTRYQVTDMITGDQTLVKSDAEGYVAVDYGGWNMKGVYLDQSDRRL